MLKTLHSRELDQMVLDLFAGWGHLDWFWRNASDGRTQDSLLKSHMIRTTQIARAHHREGSILTWTDPASPRGLFMGVMVFCSTDNVRRAKEAEGLYKAISQHWEPEAINQAFTWMQGHNSDNWSRCRKAVKKEKGRLVKSEFVLFDHLSVGLQDRLNLCRSLGMKPSVQILQQADAIELPIIDIGPLV